MEQRTAPGAGQENDQGLETSHASSQAIDPGAFEAAEAEDARASQRANRQAADESAGEAPRDTIPGGGPAQGDPGQPPVRPHVEERRAAPLQPRPS